MSGYSYNPYVIPTYGMSSTPEQEVIQQPVSSTEYIMAQSVPVSAPTWLGSPIQPTCPYFSASQMIPHQCTIHPQMQTYPQQMPAQQPAQVIQAAPSVPVTTPAASTVPQPVPSAPSTVPPSAPTTTEQRVSAVVETEVTRSILTSSNPLEMPAAETITVVGETGQLLNKPDEISFSGPLPLQSYPINEDTNPEIIRKKPVQKVEYTQEIAVRYLKPPMPPMPSEIRLIQEKKSYPPPAPPIVIRQQPARPETPPTLILREAPPPLPPRVEPKTIMIPAKKVPPPPRKVIIERLPVIPTPPQSIIVERWLPYEQPKRRVIFEKPAEVELVYEKPRNVIIQWDSPDVIVRREIKDFGIVEANPDEYSSKYAGTLKSHQELPDFVRDIQPPQNLLLAHQYRAPAFHELEGDIHALSLIDLDREGLGHYRHYVQQTSNIVSSSSAQQYVPSQPQIIEQPRSSQITTEYLIPKSETTQVSTSSESQSVESILREILQSRNIISSDRLTVDEAKHVLTILNERMGRRYDAQKVDHFIRSLNPNLAEFIDLKQFESAVKNPSSFQNPSAL